MTVSELQKILQNTLYDLRDLPPEMTVHFQPVEENEEPTKLDFTVDAGFEGGSAYCSLYVDTGKE